ncbi:DNA topoisomerase-3 [Sinobacterium caligoides]|uniref:DNA topoisomerase n=1 Tax=Sinobacterium caligoides TaxID=933926 RepID=A0A3N2DH51_9GAMM|nr:DNA topoisomerase III [Sinobacterium caligoides]ROR98704.1 DNA topoisomerase-3 [Sinobacterium caligoides]
MRLFIAEKPSLGRAIAAVLAKPHRKQDGCIYSADGDCVTWCVGHLLEQAEPQHYDPAFKKWSLEHLPIVPENWQLMPKAKTKKQLAVIKSLLREADSVVHAGDPDREGQLLVDQVLAYLGVKGERAASVQRLLISDLNPPAVRQALTQLRSNREFIPLSTSALARSRADWLYGINMTRAYTLQGRKVGYDGVLSVGRVQTPVLGLVVKRDAEIEHFVSHPFYQVEALLEPIGVADEDAGKRFSASWQPSEACRPYQDEQGRVISKPLAENVCSRIEGQQGVVKAVDKRLKKYNAPLPFNLSALQIEASKRFAMTAQQVLEHCQQLYERYQLITYPRSDSRHLPVAQHAMAPRVCASLAENISELAQELTAVDYSRRSRAWNDSKVDAHHAIIPTEKRMAVASLSEPLQQLYLLISRFYLAQFYPPYQYNETAVRVEIAGGMFVAKAKQLVDVGFKRVLPDRRQQQDSFLPPLVVGQSCLCRTAKLLEKQTEPPKPYDDATLLAAMTGIARHVSSAEVRKILKDTDGLGTEATRAGIIELLFRRKFLRRAAKTITATAAGRGLVASLPESATTADMTAQWEASLNAISERQIRYGCFMQPLQQSLYPLIAEAQAVLPEALKGLPVEKGGGGKKRRRSTGGGRGSTAAKARAGRR